MARLLQNRGGDSVLQQVFPLLEFAVKISRPLLLLIFICSGPVMSRACDLCGCYTPQLNAMPGMESTPRFPWLAGWYAAVGEQFTRFATLQLDGDEIANPTGQYLNSSITQLVAGYDINSRFALQINVPLIYREFKRPEGFQIDRGTVSGLGDMSLLLKTVAFHYASPARRFEFQGKNPVAVDHEPDFTVSAILLTGIKFPTGDSSRLEEEFHEVEVPGAPESGIHGHDLTLGIGSYDGVFGEQTALRYRNFFFETCNSRCGETAPTNITLQTTLYGAGVLVIISFVIATPSLGCSAWYLVNTKMLIAFAAKRPRTPVSHPFFLVRELWHRAAGGARK
jgi:hypothetical protein